MAGCLSTESTLNTQSLDQSLSCKFIVPRMTQVKITSSMKRKHIQLTKTSHYDKPGAMIF